MLVLFCCHSRDKREKNRRKFWAQFRQTTSISIIRIMHSLENAIQIICILQFLFLRLSHKLRFRLYVHFRSDWCLEMCDPYPGTKMQMHIEWKSLLSIQITIYVWAVSDMWLVWWDSIFNTIWYARFTGDIIVVKKKRCIKIRWAKW